MRRRATPRGRTSPMRAPRKRNPEKANAYKKRWLAAHPDAALKKRRRQRALNPRRVRGPRIRTAPWANKFFIEEIYDLARLRTKMLGTPWEVDHIIPIKGENVCGLHVETNLRVVPRAVNHKKHNTFMLW